MPKRGADPKQTEMFLIFQGIETLKAPTPESPPAVVDPKPRKAKERNAKLNIPERIIEPSDDELLEESAPAKALEAAGFGQPYHFMHGELADPDCKSASRLLQYPASLEWHDDRPRLILSAHTARDFPFVKRLEAITGLTAEDHPYEHIRDKGLWFHAWDLATDDHIDELIATRHLTTDDDIACAVAHGVEYGQLSLGSGRTLLALIGADEPADKSKATMLKCLDVRTCAGWPNFSSADEPSPA